MAPQFVQFQHHIKSEAIRRMYQWTVSAISMSESPSQAQAVGDVPGKSAPMSHYRGSHDYWALINHITFEGAHIYLQTTEPDTATNANILKRLNTLLPHLPTRPW
jgi:hypothetical protein